jgi:hypothetical protein
MRMIAFVIGVFGAVSLSPALQAQPIDDPFSDYLQRSDTILLGAGNAKDVNAAIHTITPWPPYVGNTHIPIDGRRSVDALERMYQKPSPFERQFNASGTSVPGTATGSTSVTLTPGLAQ